MNNWRGQTADQIILHVASAKCGVCTRSELRAAGVGSGAITRRINGGFLEVVGRGIYVVSALASRYTPHHVGLVAAPSGVLSLHTAAALQDFATIRRSLHMTVPKGKDNDVRGFSVHETRWWLESEIVTVSGMRCTSPARTLCDLAAHVSRAELQHLVQTQLVKRTPTVEQLVRCVELLDSPRIPGMASMRSLLDELLDDEPYPESELERRFADTLARHGRFDVRRQFRPPWYEGGRGIVDFAHVPSRTIIEADGRRWHATTQAQDEDARRDLLAATNGWLVVRLSWTAIVDHTSATMTQLEQVLDARQANTTNRSA